MSVYFADISALARRYVSEVGSAWLQSILDPVTGDADAEHERQPRRMRAAGCLRSLDRAALDVHRQMLARRQRLSH